MKWLDGLISECLRPSGTVIFRDRDEYGDLLVIEQRDHRILTFDSPFEQSNMRLSQPYFLEHEYTQFMILALAFVEPTHITLLGVGGGSLLRTLHHVLPNCFFSAVELREKVVTLARNYFSIPVDRRVSVVINDALKAVSSAKDGNTDIIFSDMYDAYQMDQTQNQQEFLQECARVLRKNGFLVINYHRLPGGDDEFYTQLHAIFPSVVLARNDGNVVLFACKNHIDLDIPDLQRIAHIEQSLQQQLQPLLQRLHLNGCFPQSGEDCPMVDSPFRL